MTNDPSKEHLYKCFFNNKTWEFKAPSVYAAKLKAIEYFKARKSQEHMISVMLLQRFDGTTVTHSTSDF